MIQWKACTCLRSVLKVNLIWWRPFAQGFSFWLVFCVCVRKRLSKITLLLPHVICYALRLITWGNWPHTKWLPACQLLFSFICGDIPRHFKICCGQIWTRMIGQYYQDIYINSLIQYFASLMGWGRTRWQVRVNHSPLFGPGGLRAPCVAWPLLLGAVQVSHDHF